MPSTFVSMEMLLTQMKADVNYAAKRAQLLKCLAQGDIRAECAEYVKSNLDLHSRDRSLAGAIEGIATVGHNRIDLLNQISLQEGPKLRCCVYGQYYTIKSTPDRYEIYFYSERPYVHPGLEIDQSYWKDAWIDENNWVVVWDDLANLTRREFRVVGFSRSDVQKYLGVLAVAPMKKRGAPRKHDVQPAAEKAADFILRTSHNLNRLAFEDYVRKFIKGPQPGKTTFGKRYGGKYTKYYDHQKCKE